MATASTIKLSPSHRPVFAVQNLTQESADKTSELLQENHDKHHIFFNDEGFHNHIAHHLLTIYALGAPASIIQEQYDRNLGYQLPAKPQKTDMHNEEHFNQNLGTREEYADYLAFFQDEIDKKGWHDVVHESLFSGTKRADDMLVRLFGGFLHPLIHLGFGVEFDQPAIIAEALAETAVHDTWMGKFLLPAEKYATESSGKPSKPLLDLLNEGLQNTKLVKAPKESDGNKLREGVIGRAGEEMARLASQWTVRPDELEARVAEMIDFCSYGALAAQRPPKEVRVDFFLMHDLNSSVFFPRLITDASATWLSPENKARLLEWKGRADLAQYFARASPALLRDEITQYTPKHRGQRATNGATNGTNGVNGTHSKEEQEWRAIFERICRTPDDGHSAKLVRAIAEGAVYCPPGKGAVTPDMWLQMAHMAVDSVEGTENRWLRSAGFESAWDDIPNRAATATAAL